MKECWEKYIEFVWPDAIRFNLFSVIYLIVFFVRTFIHIYRSILRSMTKSHAKNITKCPNNRRTCPSSAERKKGTQFSKCVISNVICLLTQIFFVSILILDYIWLSTDDHLKSNTERYYICYNVTAIIQWLQNSRKWIRKYSVRFVHIISMLEWICKITWIPIQIIKPVSLFSIF